MRIHHKQLFLFVCFQSIDWLCTLWQCCREEIWNWGWSCQASILYYRLVVKCQLERIDVSISIRLKEGNNSVVVFFLVHLVAPTTMGPLHWDVGGCKSISIPSRRNRKQQGSIHQRLIHLPSSACFLVFAHFYFELYNNQVDVFWLVGHIVYPPVVAASDFRWAGQTVVNQR